MQKIFITSGGTGGHIIPARSLAAQLSKVNYKVIFLGDEKVRSYKKDEDSFETIIISASQLKKSPIFLLKAAFKIFIGFLQSLFLLLLYRPKAVFAFGGYATFPLLLAAIITKRKIILHEQNAHLGKVNRLFAKYADKIATSFPQTSGIKKSDLSKVVLVGNLVRSDIAEIGGAPYQMPQQDKQENHLNDEARMGYKVLLASDFKEKVVQKNLFRILVIGGSGGAQIFSKILPKAFFNLSEGMKDKIQVVQQCRQEALQSTFEEYCSYNVNIAVDKFFEDMAQMINSAHLVIARAGSSSIFEFCAAKRPMILVPFAGAADNHQEKNAVYLEKNNAAIVIREKDFTIAKVSEILRDLINNEAKLKLMSDNAGRLFIQDSVQRLINLL
jgi:UDP-N-acetylglucosamine--N-acetylmuramyl-(pentapeptide) pyrophosphoryl-undecaprenol N-acetylglucosamine transferase